VLLPGRMPGVEFENLNELQEVKSMLAERVIEWTEQWKRQGLQEGLREGLQQGLERGRQEGEAAFCVCWSAVSARWRRNRAARVRAADAETLLRWGERLLTAATAEEVLRD
jgi:flagellar biosynthesis/type III secretory pathway protein FliH